MDANTVTVHRPDGYMVFQSQYNMSSSHPEYLPFNAYAPAGKVSTVSAFKKSLSKGQSFKVKGARKMLRTDR